MRDGLCLAVGRELREPCRLQTALGADAKGIRLAAQDVAGHEVADDIIEKVLLAVDEHMLDGAEGQRAFFERHGRGGINAARVDGCRDDVAAIGFPEPWDAERRVEAAGKRKNNRVFAHNDVLG